MESSSFRLIAGMGSSNNTEEKKSVEMKRSGYWIVHLNKCESNGIRTKRKQWKGSRIYMPITPHLIQSQYHLLLMECYLVKLEKKE